MFLTTVAPSDHSRSELRGAAVGVKHDGRARDIDASQLREIALERLQPVRMSKAFPGRKHYSGVYWARATGRHHWFESLYEKSALMVLDRDSSVAGIVTQPFELSWRSLDRRHFPDVLVRRADGSLLLLDIRPRERIKDRDAELFALTSGWAAALGIEYRLFADLTRVQDWNLRLLSGYRYARWACPASLAEILAAHRGEARTLADWMPLFDGTRLRPEGCCSPRSGMERLRWICRGASSSTLSRRPWGGVGNEAAAW